MDSSRSCSALAAGPDSQEHALYPVRLLTPPQSLRSAPPWRPLPLPPILLPPPSGPAHAAARLPHHAGASHAGSRSKRTAARSKVKLARKRRNRGAPARVSTTHKSRPKRTKRPPRTPSKGTKTNTKTSAPASTPARTTPSGPTAPATSTPASSVSNNLTIGTTGSLTSGPVGNNTKRDCIYAAGHVGVLNALDTMMGTSFSCALVYDTGTPNWTNWADPYFIGDGNQELNWANWAKAGSGRTLIISLEMFPSSVASDPNWRAEGAAGDFNQYATQLAKNLVAAGLGDSVIRLGFEANGDWFNYNIGNTPTQYTQWAQFWRQDVIAMRSVPGAHFQFDWCVNAAYRDIPLDEYYPGERCSRHRRGGRLRQRGFLRVSGSLEPHPNPAGGPGRGARIRQGSQQTAQYPRMGYPAELPG